jgi:GNAT superfamily N-acetyltransferase
VIADFSKEVSVLIRKVEPAELARLSSLCIDAFMGSVASTLTEEGIDTFKKIASVGSFANRMEVDNEMLACEDGGEVIGIVELKEGRHVAMLFVDPSHQKKGVGRSLIAAALPYTRREILTVNASLTSVPAYLSYGFKCTGAVGELAGLKYQPMEMVLDKSIQLAAEASAD